MGSWGPFTKLTYKWPISIYLPQFFLLTIFWPCSFQGHDPAHVGLGGSLLLHLSPSSPGDQFVVTLNFCLLWLLPFSWLFPTQSTSGHGYDARAVHSPLVLACHAELSIDYCFAPLKSSSDRRASQSKYQDILGWMALCCEGTVSLGFRMFSSIPGLYPQDTHHISSPNWWQPEVSPDIARGSWERESRLPPVGNHHSGVIIHNFWLGQSCFRPVVLAYFLVQKCSGLYDKL